MTGRARETIWKSSTIMNCTVQGASTARKNAVGPEGRAGDLGLPCLTGKIRFAGCMPALKTGKIFFASVIFLAVRSAQKLLGQPLSDRPAARLRLVGGALCLDLVNTLNPRRPEPKDWLLDYEDCIAWGHHVRLLSRREVTQLLAAAKADPAAAAAAHQRLTTFREALYRLLEAIARRVSAPAAELKLLHEIYLEGLAAARLERVKGRYDWGYDLTQRLDALLWPIASSAVVLLRTGQLSRIKVCANPRSCGWLFYDHSKNNSRRWCSMEECGNQEKSRAYYARRKRLRPAKE
jgi:predicted RNA-binding Zn ribbon-like protein